MTTLVNPIVSFDTLDQDVANKALVAWGHKMGQLHRGNQKALCHGLYHEDDLIAVTMASTLITPNLCEPIQNCTRENTIELSRLCAVRGGICRVMLRLWREFVFPFMGYDFAISYQDADLHNGHTYRFDGWTRAARSRSGTDTRSCRKGRDKWIWLWRKQA